LTATGSEPVDDPRRDGRTCEGESDSSGHDGCLVSDNWLRNARTRPDEAAILHLCADQPSYTWTWGALVARARSVAAALQRRGVRPGHVCAIVIRHVAEFYPIYMGVSLAGALPSVLAYPNPRLHPDKFREGLAGMARHSGLDWLLTERELEPVVGPIALEAASTVRGIVFPLEMDVSAPLLDERTDRVSSSRDPCLLQHSSGTTGLQKGVMLSHDAVLGHVAQYGNAIRATQADRIVSWLPLYHDMGLIAAFHLPLALGIPLIQLDPFEWVMAPLLLLEAISTHSATLCWLPNFALNFMANRIRDDEAKGLRLDSVRMIINCSEPVRSESMARFYERFGHLGLKLETLATCYAMAEATFAVTQSEPGAVVPGLRADREALRCGRYVPASHAAGARSCASSGQPIPGVTTEVRDDLGRALPDGEVGEICVRSSTLFSGYRNRPDLTADVLRDGWYHSGDYGFRVAAEHYVIGRKKDLLMVAGNNIFPEDIEAAIEGIPGVIPGRAVAVGIEDGTSGTERAWIIAESDETDPAALRRIREAVVRACMSINVTISGVELLPPRSLVKSSSGKLSRSANRERLLARLDAKGCA
jgi:fatty-acyl-CoA synthase